VRHFLSHYFDLLLGNLANRQRQTDKRTRAKTFIFSFVGGNKKPIRSRYCTVEANYIQSRSRTSSVCLSSTRYSPWLYVLHAAGRAVMCTEEVQFCSLKAVYRHHIRRQFYYDRVRDSKTGCLGPPNLPKEPQEQQLLKWPHAERVEVNIAKLGRRRIDLIPLLLGLLLRGIHSSDQPCHSQRFAVQHSFCSAFLDTYQHVTMTTASTGAWRCNLQNSD